MCVLAARVVQSRDQSAHSNMFSVMGMLRIDALSGTRERQRATEAESDRDADRDDERATAKERRLF